MTERNPPVQLLTVKQAAACLCCSQTNVYALIDAGVLPVVPVGRNKGYRIDERDLVAFIDSRKVSKQQRTQSARPAHRQLKHLRLKERSLHDT